MSFPQALKDKRPQPRGCPSLDQIHKGSFRRRPLRVQPVESNREREEVEGVLAENVFLNKHVCA